jgi:hypothetical protein
LNFENKGEVMGRQTEEYIPFVDSATMENLPDGVLSRVAARLGELLEWIGSHSEEEKSKLGPVNYDAQYYYLFDKTLQHSKHVGKNGKMRIRFDDVPALRSELVSRGFTVEEFLGLEHFFVDEA